MSSSRRSIYLDDEQWALLTEMAKAEDRSVNALVRRGVMHITQRGADQLPDQEQRLADRRWPNRDDVLRDRDEEIARLKRELAIRPPAKRKVTHDELVGYARQTGARGIPEVDAAIERGETGTTRPFLAPAVRQVRQQVIDETLHRVNRKAKS